MSSLRRLLVDNLLWWLVPLLVVLGLGVWALSQSAGPEPPAEGGPFQYDAY